ncbi:MAG TPA: 2OG-Fe(II) oxygenase family protein [Phenylobacterium sp.]|nr:2OG-Fe(II) oxygenase family protein [Phenylobacterium sp.]
MAAGPRFDPAIDPAKLRPLFGRHGRLHIPGVFRPADAKAIGEALAGDMPWTRSVNVRGKPYDLGLDQIAAMPEGPRAELEAAVIEGGRTGFQYQFDAWRLSDLVELGQRGAVPVLEVLYDFLNGEAFLGFVRTLTGEPACAYVDAQATRYTPGHFLTAHDDDVAGKNRLFAYVLNFTPAWRTDWGGLLLFHDADGHVAEGYAPTFNALNIFRVPQLHSVSPVAAYAGAPRLSVTGWIRSQRPST